MKTNVVAVASCKTVVALAAVVVTTLLMLPPFAGGAAPAATATATGLGSNCTRRCGNVSIPYPFGIEPGCFHGTGFNLTCKQHSHRQPPKLFLGDGTVQVLNISAEHSTVRISTEVTWEGEYVYYGTWGLGIPETGPYFLSESTSMLEVKGCGFQVSIFARPDPLVSVVSSCSVNCPDILARDGDPIYGKIANGSCTRGLGCCQASIVVGYSSYDIEVDISHYAYRHFGSVQIVDQSYNWNDENYPEALPWATLDWIISRSNSSACPANNMTAPECISTHSYCRNSSSLGHGGYKCQCSEGYQGNPYVQGGCQDIDECKYPEQYACYGVCKNTPGSFICQCNTGYTGNASVPNGCTDIDECKNKEAYSCYGICQNFPGSFHCQCPEGSSGNYSIKGGCITIKNSFTGLSIGLGVGGGTGLLLVALGGPVIF